MKTLVTWLAVLAMFLLLTTPVGAQVPQFVDGAWVMPPSHSSPAAMDGGYEAAIYDACARYGCDGGYLVNVAYCESGMNPNAVGAHGEIGLFQFMDYTFYAYGGGDIWNPYDQIEVAASMFSQGLSYHWVCA